MSAKKKSASELVSNRKASHDYEILETYEAGIVLLGTEVKSLRASGGNLAEAYVRVIGEELWLVGASIAPFKYGGAFNHEERRDRKLLMHKKEILRLLEAVRVKGFALIPLAFYLSKGRVKLKFAKARGKKKYDKRQAIMEREKKRDMDRAIRQRS